MTANLLAVFFSYVCHNFKLKIMFKKKPIDLTGKSDKELMTMLVQSTLKNEKNLRYIADYLGIILIIILIGVFISIFR